MGQTGSVQQKCALRDVLALRQPNVGNTAFEEVLRTFCALFPLELQVPVNADSDFITNVVGIDIKNRRLFDVIHNLLQDQTEHTRGRSMTELTLMTFRRVICWRELYKLCRQCSMKPFFLFLLQPSPTLVLAVLETLQLMLSPCLGVEAGDKAADRSEAANRRNFGESGGFDVLRSLLVLHGAAIVKEAQKEFTAKVLAGVLGLFHLTLVKRRHVTEIMTSMQAVGALMNARVSLLDLCRCKDGEYKVMRLAIALVKDLFCRVDPDEVHELQESAREYGALLYMLEGAVKEHVKENEDVRDLSVDLVEVFCTGNLHSEMTMYRIIPVELFTNRLRTEVGKEKHAGALSSTKVETSASSLTNSQHVSFKVEQRSRTSITTLSVPVTKGAAESGRNRVVALDSGPWDESLGDAREQWRDIILALRDTHEGPELVWRAPMRAELCHALQTEIESLECRRRKVADDNDALSEEHLPRWDHEMFYVEYPSMHDELVVNGYFIEYLVSQLEDSAYDIVGPIAFAWHLMDQLVAEKDEHWLNLCVRCLRLVIKRYAVLFQDYVPTQYVQLLLRDHINHSPALVRECFLLLHTAITTTRGAPSKNFYELCTTMTRTIVSVLADPVLVARFLESENHIDQDSSVCLVEPEDEAIFVVNERDALIRAGISLLLAVARRAKFVLRLVRHKRIFLCRLLAVETLDHVTITRLLFVLEQLALLDGKRAYSSSLTSSEMSSCLSSAALTSQWSSSMDDKWTSLTLVYVLLASCDPKGMGMCVAAAKFLQKCCAMPPSSRSDSDLNGSKQILLSNQLNDLLNEASGCGRCGMERLLVSTSAEAFADIYNAQKTRAADVKWGQKQRVHLYQYLKLTYSGSSELSESNSSEYNVAAKAIENGAEDDDLLIGNIFLRSFVEDGGEFLSKWTPEMYSELISALLEKLVLLERRKSPYATTNGSVCPEPLPAQQPSQSRTSIGGNSRAAESWEVQVLILKALIRLVPSHGANVGIADEVFESLLAPLRRSMLSEVDQERGILSLELLVAVLSFSETHSVNTTACRLYLEKKGLSVIANALERMRTPAFQHMLQNIEVFGSSRRSNPNQVNMTRALLYRTTDVLSLLTRHQAAGVHAIAKNPNVVTALIELSSRQSIMQHVDVDAASVCLGCLGGLCHHDELRTLVINAGGLLSLVDTVAFCPAEDLDKAATVKSRDTGEHSESLILSADGHQEGANEKLFTVSSTDNFKRTSVKKVGNHQRMPSRFFGAVRSAALVLRTCLGPNYTLTSSLSSQVLCQLLTPSLVRVLHTSPDRFILELQTSKDISTATLIWSVNMRQRLHQCIATQLTKVKAATSAKTWPRWDPEHFVAADSFRFQYPELTDVLVVHDVYLSNFVATRVEDLVMGDVEMAAFSQALLISIQSHENVLRIMHAQGLSDPTKEAAVRLMRQALNKLVQNYPQHNLEVESSGDVLLSRALALPHSPTILAAAVRSFSPTDDRDWDITHIQRCSSSGIEDLTV